MERPPTAAEAFEQALAEVPAGLFGLKASLLALYTLMTEDRVATATANEETLSHIGRAISLLKSIDQRVSEIEQGHQHPYTQERKKGPST